MDGKITHYDILSLTPSMLDNASSDPALLKRAYHRALLQNHPDKLASTSTPIGNESQKSYSIDQISTAFAVLSSRKQRAEYDTLLKVAKSTDDEEFARFQTGVENVDLDDLDFDESQERWYRSCRCGNDRGYSFQESDLEEAGDDGLLMVGCQDCSLWLRVHFAVVEDEP